MSLPPSKPPYIPTTDSKTSGREKPGRAVLGRGLENLFPVDEIKHSDSLLVGLERIKPNANQPRRQFNSESLKDLSQSIKQNGLIQPIVVRQCGQDFEIIAGERRWRAAGLAGLHEIPVRVLDKTSEQSSVLALVENLQRQNLNPIELATAYQKLIKQKNWTQEMLADQLAIPRASLANYLRLLNLPPLVKTFIEQRKLSVAHAKLLLKEKSFSSQIKWAKWFIEKSLPVRAAEKLLKKTIPSTPLEVHASPPAWSKQAIKKIQDTHGIKTTLHFQKKGGELRLRFYSEKELQFILNLFLSKQ